MEVLEMMCHLMRGSKEETGYMAEKADKRCSSGCSSNPAQNGGGEESPHLYKWKVVNCS